MSDCKNGGRDTLMPALRIEVDLNDGRTLHRDLALNGCEVTAVRIGGAEFVERRTCEMDYLDTYEYPSGNESYLCLCSECGSQEWEPAHDLPLYCRRCGAEVRP